jgi:hypothetical protein
VLFLLFGSSAAGKTVTLNALRGQVTDLAIHDFDEIDVPADADTAWRHRATEEWVQRALAYQANGTDLLLAGQTPIGELLAAPSASQLNAISACLLDCDDETRLARLHARGPEWLARVPGDLEGYLNWADWMRRHAADPQWMKHVIQVPGSEDEMRWSRWDDWRAGDPRWRVRVVDTSTAAVEEIAADVARWVDEERASFHAGTHPLPGPASSP